MERPNSIVAQLPRRATRGWLPLVLLSLLACGQASSVPAEEEAGIVGLDDERMMNDLAFDSIALGRSGCGSWECPTYEVVLRRDGEARYQGQYGVAMIGDWSGSVPQGSFARLSTFLESEVVPRGEEEGEADVEVLQSDAWEFTLRAWRVGGSEPEVFQGSFDLAPVGLWVFCNALDEVTRQIEWLPS
jgi:Domain of unknown function (DUF6438)